MGVNRQNGKAFCIEKASENHPAVSEQMMVQIGALPGRRGLGVK